MQTCLMTAPSAPSRRSPIDHLSVFLATGLALSFVPLKVFKLIPAVRDRMTLKHSGCGLVGSVLGILTYVALPSFLARSPWMLLGGIVFSVIVSGHAEKVMGVHDDTRIVIDEWIGAWIAALGVAQHSFWGLLLAFVLFRIFDVIKWPFRRLQNLPGGWGVTMDDVAAGLIALALTAFLPLH